MPQVARYSPPALPTPKQAKLEGGYDLKSLVVAVRNVLLGRTNNTLDVTLAQSSLTTVVVDERFTESTVLVLVPVTASAALLCATSGVSVVASAGQAVLGHESNPAADLQFRGVVVG